MNYILLLRGINVGGNKKVPMPELKTLLEHSGLQEVRTYINSGNVVCSSTKSVAELQEYITVVLEQHFGFFISVLVLSEELFVTIANAIPAKYTNDTLQKSDVLFLWPEVDSPRVLQKFVPKPKIDHVKYIKGAVLWNVARIDAARSNQVKLVGSGIYSKITIRNVNTVRKLRSMLEE